MKNIILLYTLLTIGCLQASAPLPTQQQKQQRRDRLSRRIDRCSDELLRVLFHAINDRNIDDMRTCFLVSGRSIVLQQDLATGLTALEVARFSRNGGVVRGIINYMNTQAQQDAN